LWIGTPCQIAGIRLLQSKFDDWKEKNIYTMANFCGGFKNINNVQSILNLYKIKWRDVEYFRFRGGGQPGSMMIKTKNNALVTIDYPTYVGYTGYSKMQRCHTCIDATGELADFSCGDAWLPEYLNSDHAWSIILLRSKFAAGILQKMLENKKIVCKEITHSEILHSQKSNIESKKIRYKSRNKLYKLLAIQLPYFDYYEEKNIEIKLKKEVLIYLSHKLRYILEKFNIFQYLLKIRKNIEQK
jgi:coenzyme F420 hydrogenase subunit beta